MASCLSRSRLEGSNDCTSKRDWEAIRLGRPLFITKASIDDASLTWPAELRQYGAQVLSNESIELIFELLPVGDRDEASSTPF